MPNLHVGAYGPFIWAAYGITVAVFALLIVSSLRHAAVWRRRAEDARRP